MPPRPHPLCQSKRCPVDRRPYPPGQHGRGRIRRATTWSSFARSRSCARCTASSSASFASTTKRPIVARHHRRQPAPAPRAAIGQRRLAFRFRRHPPPGPPAREPRPFPGQREESGHPFLSSSGRRRGHHQRARAETLIIIQHAVDTQRHAGSGLAQCRPRRAEVGCDRSPPQGPDRHHYQRADDRRALLQVSRKEKPC